MLLLLLMVSRPAAQGELGTPPRPLCQHCQIYKSRERRGLCRKCYNIKSIRRKYPPVSPHGRRMRNFQGRKLPKKPTAATPGSEAKILVLRARAAQGLILHHPADAPIDLD